MKTSSKKNTINKRSKRKKTKKNKNNSSKFFSFLLIAVILVSALLFETVKTLPVGAFSENISNMPYEVPKLNSQKLESKLLNEENFKDFDKKLLFIENNIDEKLIFIETNIEEKILVVEDFVEQKLKERENKKEKIIEARKSQIQIAKVKNEIDKIQTKIQDVEKDISKIETEVLKTNKILAKAKETKIEQIISNSLDHEAVLKEKISNAITKANETIKIAADTSTKTFTIDGEKEIVPGSSEKNITYMQILQKPNDLELNLKYARQQGKAGNYKQTISTLERLIMVYPDNIEIKLYLLSVLVQADSPNKATTIIDNLKLNKDISAEDLESVIEIENEIKARGEPKLWSFFTDVSLGTNYADNVNSVSKTRTQMSSDSVVEFGSARYDRTDSASLGLTASRTVGEESSFFVNLNTTESRQEIETGDDFESYALTVGFDTTFGIQSLSPYYIVNKTDYQDDADSFSYMYGISSYIPAGDRNTFSYSYSFADAKGNHNSSDTSARDTNATSHTYNLGHDFLLNNLISSNIALGYGDSDAIDDTGDYENYDFSLRLNFAFPWAYISIGDSLSFIDYKKVDTSIDSGRLRSDYTNTLDLTITKALGDFFPSLDPNRSLFLNLYLERATSESNIRNYDYEADSISFSINRSFQIFK